MLLTAVSNQEEHSAALDRITHLWGLPQITPKQSNELEMLVSLVQEYEAEHTPIPLPDPSCCNHLPNGRTRFNL